MFFHSLKYSFLTLMRSRNLVFWCFAFPLLLGTLFHFAFGNLDADELFSPIPVAVVLEDDNPATYSIRDMLDTLSEPGEDQFLLTQYVTAEEADALLADKEIYGILHVASGEGSKTPAAASVPNPPLRLTLSAEMNSDPLFQSILCSFVEQFNLTYTAIADIAQAHPEKLEDAIAALSDEADYLVAEELGADSMAQSATYFFSLIAMACLFSSIGGCLVPIDSQANLSVLGARKSISPVHKLISILGGLCALLLLECFIMTISILYFRYILAVDFGNQLGYVMLTAFCGCLVSINLGFFVGSIGHFDRNKKAAILSAVTMACSTLSGLMIGNIRIYVEKVCPMLNHVNPAALISDAFYALAIYPSHERFLSNIVSLLIFSVLLGLGGFVLTRRMKYASL